MLFALSIALATPTSLSTTVRGGSTEGARAGLEGRLDSPVFVRGRLDVLPGASRGLHDIVAERTASSGREATETTNWVARAASIELGVVPVPALRVGVGMDSARTFTRRGQDYLAANGLHPDTLGVTRIGPFVGVTLPVDDVTFALVGQVRPPVTAGLSREGSARPADPDGTPYARRALHGTALDARLETRVTIAPTWTVDLDLGLVAVTASRLLRDLGRDAPLAPAPVVMLGVGWRGSPPWNRDTPPHDAPPADARTRL